MTGLALLVWTATRHQVWPDAVTRWSAAVFAWVTLAGPGVVGPRRRLVRLFSAAAQSRQHAASVGVSLAGFASPAVAAGWLLRPRWSPIGDQAGLLVDLTHRIAALLHR